MLGGGSADLESASRPRCGGAADITPHDEHAFHELRKADIRLPGKGIQTPVAQGRSSHFDD